MKAALKPADEGAEGPVDGQAEGTRYQPSSCSSKISLQYSLKHLRAPYLTAFVAMQVNGWHSDKTRERRWHSAVPVFIAATGLLGLMSQPRSIPLSVVLFTMVGLAYAYLPTFWAIPTELLSQSVAAAAVGMINAVGSVAGFEGPYLFGYLNTRTGSFSYGLALMMVSAIAGGLLILWAPRSAQSATQSAHEPDQLGL